MEQYFEGVNRLLIGSYIFISTKMGRVHVQVQEQEQEQEQEQILSWSGRTSN